MLPNRNLKGRILTFFVFSISWALFVAALMTVAG